MDKRFSENVSEGEGDVEGRMSAVNRACFGTNNYCLESVVNGENIEFIVRSSKSGWAAFGIGNRMANSDIYVGWLNSLGNPVVSRRSVTGYDLPAVNSAGSFSVEKLAENETESWVRLGFKVTRPIVSDNTITNTSRMIFAHSVSGPDNVDDASSAFPFHGPSKGLLDPINFLGAGGNSTAVDNTESFQNILVAHGLLFFIAWGIAPFIGIFVARYLKNIMGVWWYRVHVAMLLGVTGIFSLISFILIVVNVEEPHFDGTHQKIGLTIFVLMFLQFALGFVSNALWNPDRRAVPWWDMVHWYFGRSLLILAVVNIFLGMKEYTEATGESITGLEIGYWVWIGIMFCVMIGGHFYFGGTQHHVETSNKPGEENSE